MTEWKTGSPRELLADLRVGGWVQGHGNWWPTLLRLHKTDLTADLRKLPTDHRLRWRIAGDPNATGRYAPNRRRIIIWLGE